MLTGLTGFVFLFVLSMAVALLIYAIGDKIGAKGLYSANKLMPYACGEEIPTSRVMLNLERFFIYAVYFMVFDILGFVMVTTLSRPSNALLPLAYAGASLVSVMVLVVRWVS